MISLAHQRQLWRDRMTDRRAAARAEGMCGVCTVREASPGHRTCAQCRLLKQQRKQRCSTGNVSATVSATRSPVGEP